MDILGFFAANRFQIAALIVAAIMIWGAKKIVPYSRSAAVKERSPHARWAAFIMYALGGLALAVATVPLILWLVGLGSRSGLSALVGNLTAIVGLALGWHSVAMIVSVIRDLMDKVPDHEARQGALWIPTFAPIGFASVWQLLQNPQGLGFGLTAAIMAGITLWYAFSIAKRADSASEHKVGWKWFTFWIFVLAGFALVPLVRFVNTQVISQLPPGLAWIPQLVMGIGGVILVVVAIAEMYFNKVPEDWARRGAAFGIGAVTVFGAVGLAWLSDALSAGSSFLSGGF